MIKYIAAFMLLAAPLQAEEFDLTAIPGNGNFSFDAGAGLKVAPSYPGSDELDLSPWLTMRNAGFGEPGQGEIDGVVLLPTFDFIASRDSDDHDELVGMEDISAAYELGGRVNIGYGPLTSYVSARQGFGGHHGVTGVVGFRYRTPISDRLTLWSGLEMDYGDSEFTNTYFGVTDSEAVSSDYEAYDAGGGFTMASARFSMRYAINDITAILGEVEYSRLIGDAGDSPIVQDRSQPVVRLGISRNIRLNF